LKYRAAFGAGRYLEAAVVPLEHGPSPRPQQRERKERQQEEQGVPISLRAIGGSVASRICCSFNAPVVAGSAMPAPESRRGRRWCYPFGYYDGYGDYGSSSNNGCVSLGCEE